MVGETHLMSISAHATASSLNGNGSESMRKAPRNMKKQAQFAKVARALV